ncbi:MAG: peptidase domain protein [Candidatus Solibacter sp.]|nr:peptidase domain protein [Candidatus Solibacter sp.]
MLGRVLLLLYVLTGPISVIRGAESFQEIQSRITTFTLKNGMTFIVMERHQAPVASFVVYADVGSVQEVKGITGIAHIFEHIAFKGSPAIGGKNYEEERLALDRVDQAFFALRDERHKGTKADAAKLKELESAFQAAQEGAGKFVIKNEYGDAIERTGGRDMNAGTAWDSTRYFFSLPSNSAELWFFLESEHYLHPVMREFYKEKDVVMEERRMRTESQPTGKLLEEALHAAYKAHPYGEPVVGHMSDLQEITRPDAESFFKKYYVPANLTGVIVGDVDTAKIRAFAETYFGRIPAGPKPEPVRTVEPPQDAEHRVTLRLQAERLILMAYHKPDGLHPDNGVYRAISGVLSEGRSSRLYTTLVRDQKIAVQAFGFPDLPGKKYPGLFTFVAAPAPGHENAECEKALETEIERLKNEPVSADELDGVKRRARAGLITGLADNLSLANSLAEWQGLTGDWRNLFRQLDQLEAVKPADIQRVAKQIFTATNRTIATIEPLPAEEKK